MATKITADQIRYIYSHFKANQVHPGKWPAENPVELILGAILVQNTTWTNVQKTLDNLRPITGFDAEKILALSTEELQELIRPSGFFKNKSKAIQSSLQWFKDHNWDYDAIATRYGRHLRNELLNLHGVGQETADVYLVFIFHQVHFVADAYARRLFGYLTGTEFKTYQDLRKVVEMPDDFTTQDAEDLHGYIDDYGKLHKNPEDFDQSFFGGFDL